MGRRAGAMLTLAVVLGTVLGACRPDTVRVAFQPRTGAEYLYRVEVVADTVTAVEGLPERRTNSRFVLRARHRVMSVDDDGIGVEVVLSTELARGSGGEEIPSQTLLVRLDRAGQLTRVERVEGVPAERLGQVGLAAVFPAAAAAPPNRPLAPGDRWRIDEIVKLGDAAAARLQGRGRLASLGIVNGREVATIVSSYELPVAELGGSGGGVVGGSQSTTAEATRSLSDGAIESASSRTTARFTVEIEPPAGEDAAPLPGTVSVDVRSKTRRLR